MNTQYGGGSPFRPLSDPTSVGRVGTELTEQQVRQYEKSLEIAWGQIKGVHGLVLLEDAEDYVLLHSGDPENSFEDSEESLFVAGVSYPIETVNVTF